MTDIPYQGQIVRKYGEAQYNIAMEECAGRTVGVNPRLIPYGTRLKVGKTRGYVAEDTGGGIGWQHLDIFCDSHQEALNAGVGYKKVWAVTYKTKKKKVRVKVPIYKENAE